MKYLRITNKGSLNRKYLELIGLSTKRALKDDASVIGHKGSGTKLSAVAALRLGLDVAIASTDRWGSYLLTFDVEDFDVDGVQARQIHFIYRNTAPGQNAPNLLRYPSGMVLEAFQDWDSAIGDDDKKSFKVVREFVCNAVDADKQTRIDIVERPGPAKPGETVVYLKYTDEIKRLLLEANRYFKFMSKDQPVFAVAAVGSIYPKSEPEEKGGLLSGHKPAKTRLFVQGVLVDCDDAFYRSSIFDYSLHEKTLVSEERIIRNMTEYLNGVASLYGQLTDVNVAKVVLAAAATGSHAKLEEQALGQMSSITPASKAAWLKVVHGLFGQKLAVSSGNSSLDKDCDQIMGYHVIGSGSTYLRNFYAKLGLPKVADLVPTVKENMKFSLVAWKDLEQDSRMRFLAAFRRFADYFPERSRLPIVFYHPLEENFRRIAGFSGIGDTKFKEIWIATATATSLKESEEDLFHTLLHEGRHCETRADDYDRAFVRRADQEVVGLVYTRSAPCEPATMPNVVDPATRKPDGSPGAAMAEPEAAVITDLDLALDELLKDHDK